MKPYTWKFSGETTVGIIPLPNGGWRISATGERFTEHDEYKAYCRFKAGQGKDKLIVIPGKEFSPSPSAQAAINASNFAPWAKEFSEWTHVDDIGIVNDATFWRFVRECIIKNPELTAQLTGIPQLASLSSLTLPRDPIKLSAIREWYESSSPATPRSKYDMLLTWDNCIKFLGAKTIKDFNRDNLKRWKDMLKKNNSDLSCNTHFSRIKAILRFALKDNFDNPQINHCLDNECKVLFVNNGRSDKKPTPISRDDFQKLLHAGDDEWRTMLLVGMNCCLHINEMLDTKWSDLDLIAGTYCKIRVKTAKKRIPQVSVLWFETLEALKKIEHKSEYVFTSCHGGKFSTAKSADFRRLADRCGITTKDDKGNPLTFESVRDGAYTVAFKVSEQQARNLAGHRAGGLSDAYVLRNPESVKEACEAVRKFYM